MHVIKFAFLTSDESLQRYDDITITLSNGSIAPVTLLGHDSSTDIAVFKLENIEIPVAKIGDAINVESSGPADNAGMLLGDVLVRFDGVTVSDTGDVLAMLNSSDRIGKTINVQIIRGGVLIELAIALGERPTS